MQIVKCIFKTIRIISLALLTSLISGCQDLTAQVSNKPEIEISGSINIGLYEGYPIWGPGTNLKALWPVGKKGNNLVAALGYDRFMEEVLFDAYSYNFVLTSIGYRRKLGAIFLEPKLGFGTNIESGYTSFSVFGGIEPGIERKLFRFSLDYRFISAGGLLEGDHFHTLSLRVGYKITGAWK